MVNQNNVVAWKWLKEQLNRISDPILKNAMLAEFKRRAWNLWGYNPETAFIKKEPEKIELDDWEKELVKDIEKAEQYQIDTRVEKREKTKKEFKIRMKDFITKGGKFSDLPKELQNEHIAKAYLDAIYEEMENCINFLEKN